MAEKEDEGNLKEENENDGYSPLIPIYDEDDLNLGEDSPSGPTIPLPKTDYGGKICLICGKEYDEKYKFCTSKKCIRDGKPSKLIEKWKCRYCGTDFAPYSEQGIDLKHCPNCGNALPQKQHEAIWPENPEDLKNGNDGRHCNKCGETYTGGEDLCPVCGNVLTELKCVKCGAKYIKDQSGKYSKYCPDCGEATVFAEPKPNPKPKPEPKPAHSKWLVIITAALLLIDIGIFIGMKASSQSKICSTSVDCNIGDIIEFGSYPYYASRREKAIKWQILEKYDDGTALVISKYALDNVKYNETYTNVTWETSSIRKWLNNDFYNKAFRNADKSLIKESYVVNKDNAEYNTKGGNYTYDKMFLLSIEEAEKYFSRDKKRKLWPTPYARSRNSKEGNLYISISYGGSCWWWLRSPGYNQNYAASVTYDGDVYSYGTNVNYDGYAVRVAFKINLKNL